MEDRIEVLFQGEDGERLAAIGTVVTPDWDDSLPAHWTVKLVRASDREYVITASWR